MYQRTPEQSSASHTSFPQSIFYLPTKRHPTSSSYIPAIHIVDRNEQELFHHIIKPEATMAYDEALV
jgi:hypothetical protein